jgi:DNA (cytosine-5)-methyltransferase 1
VRRVWEHVPAVEAADIVAADLARLRTRLRQRRERGATPTAIDLFAGAGGSTAAGYRVLAAIENDDSAADSYGSNHPDVDLHRRDIRDVDPKSLRMRHGIERGQLTLLNACPPCQGFSTLGNARRDDERNDLVAVVQPFLVEFLPRAFVVENVPGLRRDARLQRLAADARQLGYAVNIYIVNAADFGVPQNRRRLIALGVRSGSEAGFPEHLSELLPPTFTRTPPAIRDVLDKAGPIGTTIDPIHRARTSTPEVARRIRAIPPNGGRFDLPYEMQLACHRALSGRRSATAAYGRIRLEGPAPTLTTRCTTPACGRFVHPTEHRGISLREAALIQTFPPRYRFAGTYQSMEAQIGNAVPARLAEAVGRAVGELVRDIADE